MRIALALVLLVCAGCAGPAPVAGSGWAAARADADAPTDLFLDLSVRDAAAALGLGAPLRIDARPVENLHVVGQIDTVRTYVWDGLAVSDYETAPGKTLRMSIRATAPGYTDSHGLGVGSTWSAVEAALGEADHVFDDGTHNYPFRPEPFWTTVNVRYDGDRVAEITWAPEID